MITFFIVQEYGDGQDKYQASETQAKDVWEF